MAGNTETALKDLPKGASQEMETKAFTEKMKEIVKSTFINLGLALGVHLGLFKTLCNTDVPMTSQQIADVTDCKERYVREWLYMMTAAEVVEMSETGEETFLLPAAHRPGVLSLENKEMAPTIPTAPIILGQSFPPLTDSFRKNGPLGVDSSFGHQMLLYLEPFRPMPSIAEALLEQAPTTKQLLEEGINCLDMGGGRGTLAIYLAKQFPKSTFWTCDLNTKAMELGMAEAEKLGLKNITFHTEDVSAMPESWTGKFGYVLMNELLHDVPFPLKISQEAYRVLAPGGFMSVVDPKANSNSRITARQNHNVQVYAFSLFYCLSQSLATEGSVGLGTAAGVEKLTSILNEAGFQSIQQLTFKIYSHLLCQK